MTFVADPTGSNNPVTDPPLSLGRAQMALTVVETIVYNVYPSIMNGSRVAAIKWNRGVETISKVRAKISGGTANFNLEVVAPGNLPGSGFTYAGIPSDIGRETLDNLFWHLRADDLGTGCNSGVSSGDILTYWRSYNKSLSSFRQSGTKRPTYQPNLGPGDNTDTVWFDGTDDSFYKYSAGNHAADFTFEDDISFMVVIGDLVNDNDAPILGSHESSPTHDPTLYGMDEGRPYIRDNSGDYKRGTEGLASDQLRYWEYNTVTDKGSEYVDGAAKYTGDASIPDKDAQFTFDSIGAIAGIDLTGYFDGGISEIMLFDGVLTNDRRELMEGYLAHKWGLAGNLPAAHPYKSNNPYTKSYLLSSDLIIGPDYGSHNLVSQSMADGDTILFYIPNCQNPGVLTVELTYGVGIG